MCVVCVYVYTYVCEWCVCVRVCVHAYVYKHAYSTHTIAIHIRTYHLLWRLSIHLKYQKMPVIYLNSFANSINKDKYTNYWEVYAGTMTRKTQYNFLINM